MIMKHFLVTVNAEADWFSNSYLVKNWDFYVSKHLGELHDKKNCQQTQLKI